MNNGIALRTVAFLLAIVAFIEGGYILWHRNTINRYKPVDEDGYLAFDSATGQLCKTFRTKLSPKQGEYVPSATKTPGTKSADPILDMIQNGSSHAQEGERARIEFIRALPACADIP